MSQPPAETPRERGPVPFPPPLIYITGLGAAIVLERIWPTPNLPIALAILAGLAGGAASAYLDLGATRSFAIKKTPVIPWHVPTALVTKGNYRFTRNPMYLGMAALLLGLSLAFGFLWGVALLPLVVLAVDRLVIAREEAYLAKKFGAPYLEYKERVRRWI